MLDGDKSAAGTHCSSNLEKSMAEALCGGEFFRDGGLIRIWGEWGWLGGWRA